MEQCVHTQKHDAKNGGARNLANSLSLQNIKKYSPNNKTQPF
jgi:hypothetical protein